MVNICYDKRVVRGNTYAAQILPSEPKIARVDPKKSVRPPSNWQTSKTPQAVHGRQHTALQTDQYLEELTDVVQEQDCETQTDPFMDRPATPLYIPQKNGIDAATQILQNDLFDFDLEVEPVLEYITGKILETSLLEVVEEEEIAAMRAQQQQYEAIRNAELVAVQRMEEAEKRKTIEKLNRYNQEKVRVQRETVVRQKVAAAAFARGYLNGLVQTTIEKLQASGFFYVPVIREVEDEVMPWLVRRAGQELQKMNAARNIVKEIIKQAQQAVIQGQAAGDQKQQAQLEAQEAYRLNEEQREQEEQVEEEGKFAVKATFILYDLHPRIVSDEEISTARKEIEETYETESQTIWEQQKQRAGDEARAEAEEQLAKWQKEQEEEASRKEQEQKDKAGNDGQGATPEEASQPQVPPVDVEVSVTQAIEAVPKPENKVVKDFDILNKIISKEVISKDKIITSLALHCMGNEAYCSPNAQ